MKLYPTGDSYFGCLLNSCIHVLMYSYYCLTLLGVRCPWKKYLTQAQLAQFASVVVYTAFCLHSNWKSGQLASNHIWACVIQVGEMVSLFVLFSSFYRRSYKAKKQSKSSKAVALTSAGSESSQDDREYKDECNVAIQDSVDGTYIDECQRAVKSLVEQGKEAARDTSLVKRKCKKKKAFMNIFR